MIFSKYSYSKLVLMMALSAVCLGQLEAKYKKHKGTDEDSQVVCKKGDKHCRSDKKCKGAECHKGKKHCKDGKAGKAGHCKKSGMMCKGAACDKNMHCKKGKVCDSKRGGHKSKHGRKHSKPEVTATNRLSSTMDMVEDSAF